MPSSQPVGGSEQSRATIYELSLSLTLSLSLCPSSSLSALSTLSSSSLIIISALSPFVFFFFSATSFLSSATSQARACALVNAIRGPLPAPLNPATLSRFRSTKLSVRATPTIHRNSSSAASAASARTVAPAVFQGPISLFFSCVPFILFLSRVFSVVWFGFVLYVWLSVPMYVVTDFGQSFWSDSKSLFSPLISCGQKQGLSLTRSSKVVSCFCCRSWAGRCNEREGAISNIG
ncbi:hypothetical protein F5Y17DRAFT_120262 [Xylariaceae sp. FL0594]|nr:hypothetical protein F5Y17DRAFT_120262 [Xylariaceae sp. FL0594]